MKFTGKRKKILRKLLLQSRHRSRLWAALLALCIGTTLLLLSVMIWWNFQQLLNSKGENDSLGSTFITVSKKVTDQNMGKPQLTQFSGREIEELSNAPEVQDVGELTANRFPVYATLNASFGFETEMFLESAPERFIDKKPVDWYWQPGSPEVPIIVSSEFLNLYNYGFAVSQGLPQLSRSTIQSLMFDLRVGTGDMQHTYKAHIVGFSDRINSVLVPDSFLEFGNRVYGNGSFSAPTRLIVKVKDPSDDAFVDYLQQNNYVTNSEQLRWNKLRSVVAVVTSATGILAILLMGIGALVFILFIELTIARAQQSITLLLQLGYGPAFLSRFMIRRFFPMLAGVSLVSMGLATLVQRGVSKWINVMHLTLPQYPGWQVWIALLISTCILLGLVAMSIVRALKNT